MAPNFHRNLLFGIFALQMDFISREQLVAATSVWLLEKTRPLEEILLEQDALCEEDRQLLAPLVARHIENHDDNAEKSLAALSSIGSLREDLQALNDPQLEATLSVVSRDHGNALTASAPGGNQRLLFDRRTSGGSRFRILRPHAKGGLGKVSVAEDTELAREVALKEIHAQFADDLDSRSRFVLEAEVTGGLEHPGIVPVYGLGQYENGRPYYAMRFIRGDSLKEAADQFHENTSADESERALVLRQLLGRFVDVCNAIAYAHSRGVLHRDLKPGNVMLGKYGETLVVDWGLAKTAGRDDTAKGEGEGETALTPRSGSAATQMGVALGTPAYMPPEQAAGKLDELGPASDVYSLGATLYYVLTGQQPITGKGLMEVLKKVRAGDFAPPRTIKHDIPKSLEAICLRAMALQPQDRYASPQSLADDIERFLADEAVSAHADPVSVRARRWLRKHPKSVAALAATVLVGLTSTVVIATVVSGKNQQLAGKNEQLAEANQQLDDSNHQLGKANTDLQKSNTAERKAKEKAVASQKASAAVLAFFENKVLAAARPEEQGGGLGIDATIRAAVDAAEPLIAKSFADQPLVEASIRSTLGTTYGYLGEAELALRQHQRARTLREAELGLTHPDTLASMNNLASVHLMAWRTPEATALYEEVFKRAKAKLGPEHDLTLEAMLSLGAVYRGANRMDEAIALDEEVFKLTKAKLGPEHPLTLRAMYNLASHYRDVNRRDEAIALEDEAFALEDGALKLMKTKLGPEHIDTLKAMLKLSARYRDTYRLNESLALGEETFKLTKAKLGLEHIDTLTAMSNLAATYFRMNGRMNEAIAFNEEILKLTKAKFGPEHPNAIEQMLTLAWSYDANGRLDEAIALNKEIVKLRKAKWGLENRRTLAAMGILAISYTKVGRPNEAMTLFEEAFKILKATRGPEHSDTLAMMGNMAGLYLRTRRRNKAIALYEEILKLEKAKLGPEHPKTRHSINFLARMYLANEPKKALPLFAQLLANKRRKKLKDDPRFAGELASVSLELLQYKQYAAAEPYLHECLAIREKKIPDDWLTFNTRSMLGGALFGQAKELLPTDKEAARKKFAEAEPLLVEGYEGLKTRESKIPAQGKVRVTEALKRLVDIYTAWEKPEEAAKWQATAVVPPKEASKPVKAKPDLEHFRTLREMRSLVEVYRKIGQVEKATAMLEETLKLQKAKLGPEHLDTLNAMSFLARTYLENEQPAKALPWIAEFIAGRRKTWKKHHSLTSDLASVSYWLSQHQQYAAAEPYLRECLAIREKRFPEHWLTFHTRSSLGGVLLGQAKELLPTGKEAAQKKFVEAEPLLVEGYEGLKARESKISAAHKTRIVKALERLVDLYTAWEKPEEAAKWQVTLDAAKLAAEKKPK